MSMIPAPPRSTAIPAAGMLLLAAALILLLAAPAAAQDASTPAIFADVNRALESQRTGIPVRWQDAGRRQSGTIIVRRTYYNGSQPCRDYTRTTEVGGTLISTTSGTGCRIGAGVWSLTEQPPRMTGATPPAPATGTGTGPVAAPKPGAPSGGATGGVAARPPADGTAADAEPGAETPDFVLPAPGRKPVLIFASRPTPSDWN